VQRPGNSLAGAFFYFSAGASQTKSTVPKTKSWRSSSRINNKKAGYYYSPPFAFLTT
jgi:hypothetical protein